MQFILTMFSPGNGPDSDRLVSHLLLGLHTQQQLLALWLCFRAE
ncbi:hypothetical protein CsSME_00047215 [Camellia sinensis var. sinensis]